MRANRRETGGVVRARGGEQLDAWMIERKARAAQFAVDLAPAVGPLTQVDDDDPRERL